MARGKLRLYHWFGDRVALPLNQTHIEAVPRQGQADDAIAELLTRPEIVRAFEALDAGDIRAELTKYGAWNQEELSDAEQNRARLLWIACGDVRDNPEEYRA